MATIKDVAFAAGVSVGTVSRVLAENGTVTTKMRLRVETAIAELGFRPNFAARALRRRQTDIIGLVIPDITNPFFAQLAKHVESAATKIGFSVILANTNDDPDYEEKQVYTLLEHSPRGIILTPSLAASPRNYDTATRIIALDRSIPGYPCIATNHESSARLAANHILDLGHRRIAYIAGPLESDVANDRKRGFRMGLDAWSARTGIEIRLDLRTGLFDFASGEALAKDLLEKPGPLRPTAIVAASDQQAIGVLRAARDLAIRVPVELSVVGFDDIAMATLITPRLTTIRQSIPKLAAAAVAAIVSDEAPAESALYPGKLVVRNSSAPLLLNKARQTG